jgi:hypothetical protein
MRARALAALGFALLLAGRAGAAPPRAAYPNGRLVAAGVAVAADQVLDARALPDMAGKPSLMVTLAPAAASAVKARAGGDTFPVTLDGKTLGASPAAALAESGALMLSGDYGDYAAASALARRISGHDPVPDSESDE